MRDPHSKAIFVDTVKNALEEKREETNLAPKANFIQTALVDAATFAKTLQSGGPFLPNGVDKNALKANFLTTSIS